MTNEMELEGSVSDTSFDFTLHRGPTTIPATFWNAIEPAGSRTPLTLLQHGGPFHKRHERSDELAQTIVARTGGAVLLIDGPIHGQRRTDSPGVDEMLAAFELYWREDVGIERMVSDWKAVLDAVLRQGWADPGRIAWFGTSMGTAYGIPLCATDTRIKAAAIGMWGIDWGHEAVLLDYARQMRTPALFQIKSEDEIFSTDGQRKLFDALGCLSKSLHTIPGGHSLTAPGQLDQLLDFIVQATAVDRVRRSEAGTPPRPRTDSLVQPNLPVSKKVVAGSGLRSRSTVEGPLRVANRMHLRATGLDDEAIAKPFVGVVHTHGEVSPCAMSLAPQAAAAKLGIEVAGGTARESTTVSISDVWTMVHEHGPQYSLISREVVADSVELVLQGQRYDAAVTLGACDKTVPGMLMAMTRVNIPSVYVHGGAALRGWSNGDYVNFYRVFGDMDGVLAGQISEAELECLNGSAMASVGTCPGLNTASTGAACAEIMGFCALGTISIPAVFSQRVSLARKAGQHAVKLLTQGGPLPRDWVTRESLENAVTVVAATRGSSNMLLHLPAIANEAGIKFELNDMAHILRRTPRITSLIPNGPHALIDLHRIGGLPVVFRSLLESSFLHPQTPTNDGRSLAEALAEVPLPDGTVVRPCDNPFQPDSGIVVLRGNLAPGGCILKTVELSTLTFEGPARIFEGDAEARKGIADGKYHAGDVIIVRGEGPRGSPGMREMLDAPIPIRQRGMGKYVALVTDGRWPVGTGGPCVAHVSPEAHGGGPLALVKDGDIVRIDAEKGSINFNVSDEEIGRRRSMLSPSEYWVGGLGEKYARLVGPTHLGAPTHSYRR